MVFRASV